MRRVNNDRQMAQALESRNSADIQRISGIGFVGADAALAQDDLIIAACHDVLGGHQEFFQCIGETALEQNRCVGLAQLLEQLKVLHVAGADLIAVYAAFEQLDVRRVGDFCDDRHAGLFLCDAEQIQTLCLHALEGVRGGTRLPRAATQNGCTLTLYFFSNFANLRLALDRARACHHDDFFAADFHIAANLYNGVVRVHLTVCQLERLLYLHDAVNPVVEHQRVFFNGRGIADQTQNGSFFADDWIYRYVKMLDPVGKAFYFFLRASFFQYNDHDIFSPWK